MDDYCAHLLAIINDREAFRTALLKTVDIIGAARLTGEPWKEPPERMRSFSAALLSTSAQGKKMEPAETARKFGVVHSFSPVKGLGFISSPDFHDRWFFHQSDFKEVPADVLTIGRRLILVVLETPKGLRAGDIELSDAT